VKNRPHFTRRQNDRQPPSPLCGCKARNKTHVSAEYVAVQKEQGVQRLILCRRADASIGGKVIQKRRDLVLAHERWVAAVVENHKPPDPGAIGDLCPFAVVSKAQASPDSLQQSKSPRWIRCPGEVR
jgi:hypothetical protein